VKAVKVTEPTLTYSRTPPGENALCDAVNLAVAVRMGQQRMAETILDHGCPPSELITAMSAFTDILLASADELMPGFAVRVLNHFTANL